MLCTEKTFEQFNKEQEESRQRLSKYYQGHSGMSWEFINSMIREFCDCGNEFLEQLMGKNHVSN